MGRVRKWWHSPRLKKRGQKSDLVADKARKTAKSVAKGRAFYPFCTFTMPIARPQYGHLAMGANNSATSTSSAIAMRWSVSRLGELRGLIATDIAAGDIPIFAAKSLCVIPFS